MPGSVTAACFPAYTGFAIRIPSSGLRAEFTRTIEPARSLAQETLKLECTLSDLFNQAYGFTPEDIDLMWKRAPPRMPIPAPGTRKGQGEPGHENSEG